MAFTRSTAPAVIPSLFSIEGADEFSSAGIPGTYQFSWDAVPWIEAPLSLRGAETNPLPNIDTMDPEQRNALLNGGYDPLTSLLNHVPQYSNLDISKYRFDPFGGYMQYQDKAGNTGYLMSPGKTLAPDLDLRTNYENTGLPVFRDPSKANQEWWQMGYDPYGAAAANKSLYKLAEPVGQGWFSQNMDWLVPLVIGGVGGGMAASGVGMSGGAAGTATGTATGAAGGAAGAVPAWAPATAGTTFNTSLGILPSIMEAQTLSGIGLTAAEMAQLGVEPWAAKIGSMGLPQITGPDPKTNIWDLAKKIPALPSGALSGTGEGTGGDGGDSGDGMSLWSNTVNPYAYAPPSTGTPIYQAHEATPYGFEDELQKRLALIRGAR